MKISWFIEPHGEVFIAYQLKGYERSGNRVIGSRAFIHQAMTEKGMIQMPPPLEDQYE